MIQNNNADPREGPRTNMFLGAVIRGAGVSAPVKVRNMSVTGALVEGTALPDEGAEVQLVRGSLAVSACVAWCSEGRCGLRFSALVCVRDWMAPLASAAQQRVDDTVRVLKLGAVPLPERRACPADPSDETPRSLQIGEDLRGAMALIRRFGDGLASDDEVLTRHGHKLQNVDIALQMIGVVADSLTGITGEDAAATRLANLRVSAAAALHEREAAQAAAAP